MAAENSPATEPTEPVLVITRVFDAPGELVFKAWTESEHLKRWWGPKGFTMGVSKLDLRTGGVFLYSVRSPDGHEMWGKFVYREMVAPERLVFVNSFSDEEGNAVRHPLSQTWPLEILNTLTFAEHEGRTALTMRGVPLSATEAERKTFEAGRDSVQKGFAGTFDQLTDYLAKIQTDTADREIVMTRLFDAPRELVFKAWTDPEHVAQWWGPNGFTNTIHEMDVRPGGVWRFVMHGPDSVDYKNKIIYLEIVKPERLVYSHGADDGGEPEQFHVTVTFAEQGGKTHLTMRTLFESAAERNKTVEFGAIELGNQSLARLEEHLAKM